MKVRFLLAVLVLGGCSQTTTPQIVQDAQLFVTGLESALPLVSGAVGVKPGDVALVQDALSVVSSALTAEQAGTLTSVALATLVSAEAKKMAPQLLIDLKANATITSAVTGLVGLANVILGDAGVPAKAGAPLGVDYRQEVNNFVKRHPAS
jgi:hypothetical protein